MIYIFITQIALIFFVLWLIDKVLLAIFGAKWRMSRKYEEEREKRFWHIGDS